MNGNEEVKGSIPFGSTKSAGFPELTQAALLVSRWTSSDAKPAHAAE